MINKRIFFIAISFLAATFVSCFSQETKGGSVIYEQFRTLPPEEREHLILDEVKNGNYPSFLDNPVSVSYTACDSEGVSRKVTLFVSPNYVSVGSKDDIFIVPLTPMTGTAIARLFDASLPTPMLVDTIYERASLKLEPFNYIPRGNRNETPDILYDHSRVVMAQIKAAGEQPDVFVAGVKKDVVISSKLSDSNRDHHVTIYGWHKLDGKPIQPVTNIHIDTYVDYSHGIRLVMQRVLVDGEEHRYDDILRDPLLYTLLSREQAPLQRTSYNQ
jgi:hypothetical protein